MAIWAAAPTFQVLGGLLRNHLGQMVSVDFLTVPTLRFEVLYIFVVLSHARRQVLHFNVTASPSASWVAQQLREAFCLQFSTQIPLAGPR